MIKLGIIGYPLAHSMSPLMHNAALKELGIEGNYQAYETEPEKLGERIEFFKKEDFKGFNVTIPYKVDIIPYLDEIDDFAKSVGAVNTVVINDDKTLKGYNTDVYGFTAAIDRDSKDKLKGKNALMLGSGGAARAVSVGLIDLGVKDLSIAARDVNQAEELKQQLEQNFSSVNIKAIELKDDFNLEKTSIVVNTTPLGMEGKFEGKSAINENSVNTLPEDAIVYDIVYKPQATRLLELAQNRRLNTQSGLEMLLLQGAKGFELWTGKPAPVNIMRELLIKSLF